MVMFQVVMVMVVYRTVFVSVESAHGVTPP